MQKGRAPWSAARWGTDQGKDETQKGCGAFFPHQSGPRSPQWVWAPQACRHTAGGRIEELRAFSSEDRRVASLLLQECVYNCCKRLAPHWLVAMGPPSCTCAAPRRTGEGRAASLPPSEGYRSQADAPSPGSKDDGRCEHRPWAPRACRHTSRGGRIEELRAFSSED